MAVDSALHGTPDSPPVSRACRDFNPAGREIVVLPTIRPWTPSSTQVSTTAAKPVSGQVRRDLDQDRRPVGDHADGSQDGAKLAFGLKVAQARGCWARTR